jgi:hypothetical protein
MIPVISRAHSQPHGSFNIAPVIAGTLLACFAFGFITGRGRSSICRTQGVGA